MAYTKYSLTPANNTAAPPDGAPEGMLPSAVNDTMRDMMAQIRDVGDGIRDGTYTMTAPKITGGTITGSTINNSAIGGTTAAAGKFTTLEATGVATFSAGTVSLPSITTTGDTNTGIFFPTADTIAFTEGGVESMRIDASGNVGIGVTPSNWSAYKALQVGQNTSLAGNTGGSVALLSTNAVFDGSSYKYITTDAATQYQQNTGEHIWRTAASGSAGATLTFTERMRIDSSGNVGIGTSSPATRLDVRCVSDVTQDIAYFSRPDAAVRAKIALDGSGIINFGTSTNHPLAFLSNNTERMRITSAGQIAWGTSSVDGYLTLTWAGQTYVGFVMNNTDAFGTSTNIRFKNNGTTVGEIASTTTTTSYNTSSDYRLKENVAPMTGALAKVAQLKPVTYKWKSNGSDGQGFIAHELQEVAPYAVSGEKDGEQMQGVDYGKITPLLTAALQEALAKIESLEARLAVLESK